MQVKFYFLCLFVNASCYFSVFMDLHRIGRFVNSLCFTSPANPMKIIISLSVAITLTLIQPIQAQDISKQAPVPPVEQGAQNEKARELWRHYKAVQSERSEVSQSIVNAAGDQFAILFSRLKALGESVRKMEQELRSLSPDADLKKYWDANKWPALSQAPIFYYPDTETLLIKAETSSQAAAINYANFLRKSELGQKYELSGPIWGSPEDGVFHFTIEGKCKPNKIQVKVTPGK
jgi:hypothetical protein